VVIHPWKQGELGSEHNLVGSIPSNKPASRPLVKAKKSIDVYKRDPKQPLRGIYFCFDGNIYIFRNEVRVGGKVE
jgi:hypothetical protein